MPLDPFAVARARQALTHAGLPSDAPVEAATSTRNEVLLCGDHVVRINRQPNQRLHREAALCQALPIRTWTPRVVAHGGSVGADYLIVARRPGRPLSRVWPRLDRTQRRSAIRQLAAALADLHVAPMPISVPPLRRTTHLLDPVGGPPLRPLWRALDEMRRRRPADADLFEAIEDEVSARTTALDRFPTDRMVHGDLTFENILWHDGEITALLDFEWCRGGPPEIDVDSIARYCRFPDAHVPEDVAHEQRPEDYAEVVDWLREDFPTAFAHPELDDRLFLLDIAFDMNEVVSEPTDVPRHRLGPMHPINRLARHVYPDFSADHFV